jgi:hypothetical protein
MIIVPNQGEQLNLDAATGKTPATAWTLRLFSNDYTPVAASTEANLTEVAGGGYAAIALTASNWVTTPGSPTSTTYPQQTFTFTGATNAPGTIYGYYITDNNGKLIFAERFAAFFTPANNGDTVKVTLVLTLGSVSGD